jgi:membrane fusion protein, copper/silver efflux system
MRNFIALFFILIFSSAFAQTIVIKEPVKSQLNAVLKSYLELKNTLVASDLKKSQEKAQSIINVMGKVDESKLEGTHKDVFIKSRAKIKSEAEQISKATSVDKQREHFGTVSDEIYQVLKTIKVNDTKIYRDYCPMANDNNGAFWLSEKKEIENPYFGTQMLTCGEVKQTL